MRENNETIYNLIQNPNRKDFATLLKDNQGEADNLDFKRSWIEFPKLATIMLGMANIGGGIIVFGLDEKSDGTVDNCGLSEMKSKADIDSKVRKYLPESLQYEVVNFDFTNKDYYKEVNGMYQIMIVVSHDRDLPYILSKQIDKDEQGIIYIRRGTKTLYANSEDMARMIEKRIHATTRESILKLDDHLAQLRVLYKAVQYNVDSIQYMPSNVILKTIFGREKHKEPNESYNDYILKIIEKKKNIIENYIDR